MEEMYDIQVTITEVLPSLRIQHMQNLTLEVENSQFLPLQMCCSCIVKIMLIWNLYDDKMFLSWREREWKISLEGVTDVSYLTLSLAPEPSVSFSPVVVSASNHSSSFWHEKNIYHFQRQWLRHSNGLRELGSRTLFCIFSRKFWKFPSFSCSSIPR